MLHGLSNWNVFKTVATVTLNCACINLVLNMFILSYHKNISNNPKIAIMVV